MPIANAVFSMTDTGVGQAETKWRLLTHVRTHVMKQQNAAL